MKKLTILALAGLVLLTAGASSVAAPPVNNQTDCNSNYTKCREYALNVDAPWYKVMVMLTVCDLAFGKCSLGL